MSMIQAQAKIFDFNDLEAWTLKFNIQNNTIAIERVTIMYK
jgi:hypothetical protein